MLLSIAKILKVKFSDLVFVWIHGRKPQWSQNHGGQWQKLGKVASVHCNFGAQWFSIVSKCVWSFALVLAFEKDKEILQRLLSWKKIHED